MRMSGFSNLEMSGSCASLPFRIAGRAQHGRILPGSWFARITYSKLLSLTLNLVSLKQQFA
jgi:hypothetical protein